MSMMCRPKWPFLRMYVFHDVRHIEFRELTGSQRTPRVWGVTLVIYFSLSYTILVHIFFMYCTLYFPYTVIYNSLSFSYTFMYYVLFIYCHISYIVILYFTSCSCNWILSSHSSAMLLISCHIFYTFHLHILVIFF